MANINEGGPAFPIMDAKELDQSPSLVSSGMTLRDYFAGQVLGMAAHDLTEPEHVAQRAYAIADAMLKAREAQP